MVISKTVLELLAQDLRECLWEVLQETNEIPIYMENKSMEMEKQRMDMFMNYEEEEYNFYEECIQQFRQMTKRLKDILVLKE